MWKQRTLLWREARFQVKMSTAHVSRTGLEGGKSKGHKHAGFRPFSDGKISKNAERKKERRKERKKERQTDRQTEKKKTDRKKERKKER